MAGKKKKIIKCAFSLVMMGKAGVRRRKDNLEIKKGVREREREGKILVSYFLISKGTHTHTQPSPPP